MQLSKIDFNHFEKVASNFDIVSILYKKNEKLHWNAN